MGRRWCAWRRLGERDQRWRGLRVGVAYGWRGEGEARCGSWGEGVVDMGRLWRGWWRLGERERRERGPRGSLWRLGERARREWVVEARWRCGERERRGLVRRAGGGAGAPPLAGPGLVARVGPVGRCRRVLGALARRRMVLGGAGGSPPPSFDPPRRGAVAAAAGGTGQVTVPGGVGPGGPLWRGRGGRGDTVPCTRGVAPDDRRGMGVERPVPAIPYAAAARARGVVAR